MPSALPDGEPAPADGRLPEAALNRKPEAGFGVYVHIPFCATRCGYCDFNTYTATELGSGVNRDGYPDLLRREIELAASVLDGSRGPVETVFIGGGTPTLLSADALVGVVSAIDDVFGMAPAAEVTTEANPETVDQAYLERLREGGFDRISMGMQSLAGSVLAVLGRSHTPGRAIEAVAWAQKAGFEHINVDLIYGTPGERPKDFRSSLAAAVDAGVDHVSAYSLIVEDGTALAAKVRRGDLPWPSDDVAADRYLMAEDVLSAAGLSWYEVSNWAATPAAACRHNQLYWRGGDWWGFGPGAHSHVAGVRWWNVKHPARYGERLSRRLSPAHGRENLTDRQRYVEDVMLRIRLAEGMPVTSLDESGRAVALRLASDGLLDGAALAGGTARLTLRGRLLADVVVRDLLA